MPDKPIEQPGQPFMSLEDALAAAKEADRRALKRRITFPMPEEFVPLAPRHKAWIKQNIADDDSNRK